MKTLSGASQLNAFGAGPGIVSQPSTLQGKTEDKWNPCPRYSTEVKAERAVSNEIVSRKVSVKGRFSVCGPKD
ncbi:MAG: hypothetical protein WCP17_01580 [bacterium]